MGVVIRIGRESHDLSPVVHRVVLAALVDVGGREEFPVLARFDPVLEFHDGARLVEDDGRIDEEQVVQMPGARESGILRLTPARGRDILSAPV